MDPKLDVRCSVCGTGHAVHLVLHPSELSPHNIPSHLDWSRNLYRKLIGVSAGHAHMLTLFLSIDEEDHKYALNETPKVKQYQSVCVCVFFQENGIF